MAGYIGNFPTAIPLSGNDIADGTITNSDLANSSITVNGTSIDLGASGNISAGIEEADQWRLTVTFTGNADPIASNWERNDSNGFNYLGTGMTQSSGIFTFPSTGYWLIRFQGRGYVYSGQGNSQAMNFNIKVSIDGTNHTPVTNASNGAYNFGSSLNTDVSTYSEYLFDVTNTSTHKCSFSYGAGQGYEGCWGNSSLNLTSVSFVRLGDT